MTDNKKENEEATELSTENPDNVENNSENSEISESTDASEFSDKVDPDIEIKAKHKHFTTQGGIETEEYDAIATPKKDEELLETIKDKVGIEIEYSFNGEDVKEGLAAFQSVVLKKRNMIYTVILVLIFVMYSLNVIKNPTETLSIVLAVVSVTVLAFVWIMPKTHIKKVAEAADKAENNFTMTIFDNCIQLGADNGSFLLSYDKNITHLFETARLFLVCAGKEQVFILPKRFLQGDTEERIKAIFIEQGGTKFKVINN